jgi:hypothetical protein
VRKASGACARLAPAHPAWGGGLREWVSPDGHAVTGCGQGSTEDGERKDGGEAGDAP